MSVTGGHTQVNWRWGRERKGVCWVGNTRIGILLVSFPHLLPSFFLFESALPWPFSISFPSLSLSSPSSSSQSSIVSLSHPFPFSLRLLSSSPSEVLIFNGLTHVEYTWSRSFIFKTISSSSTIQFICSSKVLPLPLPSLFLLSSSLSLYSICSILSFISLHSIPSFSFSILDNIDQWTILMVCMGWSMIRISIHFQSQHQFILLLLHIFVLLLLFPIPFHLLIITGSNNSQQQQQLDSLIRGLSIQPLRNKPFYAPKTIRSFRDRFC